MSDESGNHRPAVDFKGADRVRTDQNQPPAFRVFRLSLLSSTKKKTHSSVAKKKEKPFSEAEATRFSAYTQREFRGTQRTRRPRRIRNGVDEIQVAAQNLVMGFICGRDSDGIKVGQSPAYDFLPLPAAIHWAAAAAAAALDTKRRPSRRRTVDHQLS